MHKTAPSRSDEEGEWRVVLGKKSRRQARSRALYHSPLLEVSGLNHNAPFRHSKGFVCPSSNRAQPMAEGLHHVKHPPHLPQTSGFAKFLKERGLEHMSILNHRWLEANPGKSAEVMVKARKFQTGSHAPHKRNYQARAKQNFVYPSNPRYGARPLKASSAPMDSKDLAG
ncbi:hypothetical protein SUGI_0579930 [Cryptomeria japonica]|nr:hypothetical protein SUGI_0579930 [Cryptomeria japonica]